MSGVLWSCEQAEQVRVGEIRQVDWQIAAAGHQQDLVTCLLTWAAPNASPALCRTRKYPAAAFRGSPRSGAAYPVCDALLLPAARGENPHCIVPRK
jgi:hypothetical protein